jgi:adenylate cyclase class 2
MSTPLPQEIEAKFLHVNHDELRARLQAAGATLETPMRQMRRSMLDFDNHRFQRPGHTEKLRVRDEGDKITFTYKKTAIDSNYSHELETTVGSYADFLQIMEALGIHTFSYQESRREIWHLDDVEVVLDEWPWLDTYIEIEGSSEPAIQAAAKALGFDWNDAKFGSVDTAYRDQYKGMSRTDSIGQVAEVQFDAPLPNYLAERQ